jgi:hypothetical protein
MLERGFTLLKTPKAVHDVLLPALKRSVTVRSLEGQRFPGLPCYGAWVQWLLQMLLPEERICLTTLEYRYEPANHADEQIDRLHADGAYLRSAYTLSGASTIFRDAKTERSVPPGFTILMTAIGRARAIRVPCTLHRRPGRGMERSVIICSFEP